MWDIHEEIDALGDAINETEDSLLILQSSYDAIVSMKYKSSWVDDAVALSAKIHKCQDTLCDLKDERDALIYLLFDEP